MAAVKSLCTTCLYLQNGQLVEKGDPVKIVNHYLMRGGSNLFLEVDQTQSEHVSDLVRLDTIELATDLYEGRISIQNPMTFTVTGFNKQSTPRKFNVNIFFNSDEGECIFVTVSPITEVQPGKFEAVCVIPGNFLNDINYIVDIMVVHEGVKPLIHVRNAVFFEAVEPPRQHGWMGVMPGLIRPEMKWQFKS